jgi:hypothetical protein
MGFRVASAISSVGDYDDNSAVNAADYVNWRKFAGTATEYSSWRTNFGQSVASGDLSIQSVPEPSTLLLGVITLASLPTRRRRSAPPQSRLTSADKSDLTCYQAYWRKANHPASRCYE